MIDNGTAKLREEISNYTPFNEQEEKDKSYFIKLIDTFDDTLTRENEFGHFCASAWVLNKDRTKVLVVHHNIFNAYIYPGGHADGESNLLSVAIREVKEEIGVDAIPIFDCIFAIQSCPIKGHMKRGKYVPAHTHFDILYLLGADEKQELVSKEDENSSVKWIKIEESFNEKIVDWARPINEKIYNKVKKSPI
jgi:8-oxo-dGTP pyrophosphatase MutT (NUDIX family)